ncbi:unnamed protein product [Cyprideis torosa]|uniref:Uncharacterized protein n=1 Tax=Cyprideis torosa TaxID=163714 RepID=A0A7R8ZNJ7_9CRUS|nr:unnamed protein product [Cyprideis torosa]CAG0896495.1 unnamed protein product [Cyprideis torosa]
MSMDSRSGSSGCALGNHSYDQGLITVRATQLTKLRIGTRNPPAAKAVERSANHTASFNDRGLRNTGAQHPLPQTALACPGGGVLNPATRKCYYVKTQTKGWIEARDACRAEGFELVTIENSDENAFVCGLLSDTAWIGFNDIDIEGTFVWSDGSQSEYTNWGSGEPNNEYQEDCVFHAVMEAAR